MQNRSARTLAVTFMVTLFIPLLTAGAQAVATSQDEPRVALLELYTSEGCNSCPPVDREVSRLRRTGLVPERLVVLAFHVDYWNYLGWTDRFAQKRFSERQRAMVRANRLHTAYTPQLLLNGRDHRGLADIDSPAALRTGLPSRMRLDLDSIRDGKHVQVIATARPVDGTAVPGALALFVAVYENNLESSVRAGENRGVRLHHDFVVRELIGPVALDAHATGGWSGRIRLHDDWKSVDLGIAVFVQSTENGEVLQARAQPVDAAPASD